MYASGQFLTAKKLDAKMKAMGFSASKWLVLIILKSKVFRHIRDAMTTENLKWNAAMLYLLESCF
jgi:hypothetical protein